MTSIPNSKIKSNSTKPTLAQSSILGKNEKDKRALKAKDFIFLRNKTQMNNFKFDYFIINYSIIQ